MATLADIQKKVRLITRSPSESYLSTTDLNNYINTFITNEMAQRLRLISLRTTLTFYTQPLIDTYETNTVDTTSPLYDFKNKYAAVHQPVFIAGVPSNYTQKRDMFYSAWPQTNAIANTQLQGNGSPGPFSSTVVAHPMLKNSVIISCLDTNGFSMVLTDLPDTVSNSTGTLRVPGTTTPLGTINYVTGAFTATFPNNTQTLAPIYIENLPYQPARPTSVLYFDNKFVLRPVPDKVYPVQIEVDMVPTAMTNFTDQPLLSQWWMYIAYGTSKYIFQDRMDVESVNLIMPAFLEQEALVESSTLELQANERSTTIYTLGKPYSNMGWPYTGWPY